jgi:hypothetical protein
VKPLQGRSLPLWSTLSHTFKDQTLVKKYCEQLKTY